MNRTEYSNAYENGYAATRRFLLSRGAAVDEAEEIAQAAWVRGWEYRVQLRDPSLVGYWVNSIARNLFRARFRGMQTTPLEGLEPGRQPSYQINVDQDLDLQSMVGQCSPRDRTLLHKTLQGYTADEIARTEGITSTGIRVRLMRVRNHLRHQLAAGSIQAAVQ